ncbi:helix-turn-helix domain-containing protein [Parerythrobacter aurantius]|uniref:TetR/AcrR family transcriptional regulator n=1 Tax=Parerythrobacter aurantius TaxID=3127706 RepID=UPI00324EC372
MTEVKPKLARRTRLDPEKRRAAILDQAAEMIANEGVAALSMERIAQEASVSKSLIYNYFSNLHDLLSVLLERELRRMRRMQADAAQSATTFEELVRALTHAYIRYIDERGLIIERLQSEPTVSAIHDPTDYGRDAAVDYMTTIAARHFDLDYETARAVTDISFGLPAAAGAYLQNRRLAWQQIEDLTVTMIVGAFIAIKSDHDVRAKRLDLSA